MEYEIDDDPQGLQDEPEGDRDGGIVEDHIALKNQSSPRTIASKRGLKVQDIVGRRADGASEAGMADATN